MDELNLFRDFRTGVAAPSEDAERRASARLGSAVEGESRRRTSALHLIAKRPGYSALALVALAGATTAALFLLNLLVTMAGAKNLLEIGTLGGYSTIWMARALPAGGRIVTCEYEPRPICRPSTVEDSLNGQRAMIGKGEV